MTRGRDESKLLAEAQQVAARVKKLEQLLVLESKKRTVMERKFREQLRELQSLREQLRQSQAETRALKEQLVI